MTPFPKVPDRCASYLLANLYDSLPPPIDPRPETRETRDLIAMMSLAKLGPANTLEAQLAANAVLAQAMSLDAMAEATENRGDFKRVMQCRAQAALMMRQSAQAMRELRILQQTRERMHAHRRAEEEEDARRSARQAETLRTAAEALTRRVDGRPMPGIAPGHAESHTRHPAPATGPAAVPAAAQAAVPNGAPNGTPIDAPIHAPIHAPTGTPGSPAGQTVTHADALHTDRDAPLMLRAANPAMRPAGRDVATGHPPASKAGTASTATRHNQGDPGQEDPGQMLAEAGSTHPAPTAAPIGSGRTVPMPTPVATASAVPAQPSSAQGAESHTMTHDPARKDHETGSGIRPAGAAPLESFRDLIATLLPAAARADGPAAAMVG